jgi:hypothetical protein
LFSRRDPHPSFARHFEERTDEAIQNRKAELDCFAAPIRAVGQYLKQFIAFELTPHPLFTNGRYHPV